MWIRERPLNCELLLLWFQETESKEAKKAERGGYARLGLNIFREASPADFGERNSGDVPNARICMVTKQ